MAKPRHKSKTIGFNGGIAAAALVFLVTLQADPTIGKLLGPTGLEILAGLVVIFGAANVALRMVTHEPIKGTKAAEKQDRLRLTLPEPVSRKRSC